MQKFGNCQYIVNILAVKILLRPVVLRAIE